MSPTSPERFRPRLKFLRLDRHDGASPAPGRARRQGADRRSSVRSGIRRSRSSKVEARDESMPYLVVGVAILGLGIYSVVGQLAFYAGRVPLWILFAGVGSTLILGGTLSSLTYDDLEVIPGDPADAGSEHVLVPRQEWLGLRRLRDEQQANREGLLSTATPRWVVAHPSDGLLSALAPRAAAGPARGGSPWAEGEQNRPAPTRGSEPKPFQEAGEPPRLAPADAYDELLREVESVDRELHAASLPPRKPRIEGNPSQNTAAGPRDRPRVSPPAGTASLPGMKPASLAKVGSEPSGIARPGPHPTESGGESLSRTQDPTYSRLKGAVPDPIQSGTVSVTGSAGFASRLRARGINPCVGCGKPSASEQGPTCESCELPLCQECFERGRREGHPQLCSTCAMLLLESDKS